MVGGNRAKDRENPTAGGKYSVATQIGPVSFACLT